MQKDLIIVQNNELFVGTWRLSQGFGIEHRSLTRLVKKYKSEFLEFTENKIEVPSQMVSRELTQRRCGNSVQKREGKPFEEFLLTEEQATYLTTLLTNNETVRKFKRFLTKEFFIQRRAIDKLIYALRNNKSNAEWIEKRESGKVERRVETDAIKEFIEYAKSQGSQSSDKYYMAITKMQNAALFSLELITFEYKNLRDIVNGLSLDALKMADRIVAKAIRDSMRDKIYYKDIFKTCKARVETFADHMGKMTVDTPKELV